MKNKIILKEGTMLQDVDFPDIYEITYINDPEDMICCYFRNGRLVPIFDTKTSILTQRIEEGLTKIITDRQNERPSIQMFKQELFELYERYGLYISTCCTMGISKVKDAFAVKDTYDQNGNLDECFGIEGREALEEIVRKLS